MQQKGGLLPEAMARWIGSATLALVPTAALAQIYEPSLPADHPAILYREAPLDDPVARLAKDLESGGRKLDFDDGGLSYLPSLLDALGVPADSQVLVFSKTSLQENRISPRTPRGIYFGDDVAIAFVPGGDVIEIAAVDPTQGVVFYVLGAAKSDSPRFVRPEGCLRCHQGPATLGVPGMYVGSAATTASGRADFRLGSIVSDHRTPLEDRWGGWYVNGTLEGIRHRGNTVALDPAFALGAPEEKRMGKMDVSRYPSPRSDVVALMTLEHQTQMTNLLTRLGWEARIGEEETRLSSRVEEVVRYMLFGDEAPLPAPVRGASSFTETFPRRGPRDSKGRSLRDFDLETRLFRYPLSYMIYSEAFDALPDSVRERVYRGVHDGLAEEDAIREILRETKPNLPALWR